MGKQDSPYTHAAATHEIDGLFASLLSAGVQLDLIVLRDRASFERFRDLFAGDLFLPSTLRLEEHVVKLNEFVSVTYHLPARDDGQGRAIR